jgi:HEPN domain-containing protein
MSKQTAVEWLFNKMITEKHTISEWNNIREEAKELEKEQIITSYNEGSNQNGFPLKDEAEQYYNETYKNEEK